MLGNSNPGSFTRFFSVLPCNIVIFLAIEYVIYRLDHLSYLCDFDSCWERTPFLLDKLRVVFGSVLHFTVFSFDVETIIVKHKETIVQF